MHKEIRKAKKDIDKKMDKIIKLDVKRDAKVSACDKEKQKSKQ